MNGEEDLNLEKVYDLEEKGVEAASTPLPKQFQRKTKTPIPEKTTEQLLEEIKKEQQL